eukprot:2625410-Amphidinium_carterae.1
MESLGGNLAALLIVQIGGVVAFTEPTDVGLIADYYVYLAGDIHAQSGPCIVILYGSLDWVGSGPNLSQW